MNEPASSQSHQTPTSRTRIIIAFLIAVFPAFAWSIFFGDIAPQDDAGEYWKLGVQWAETGVYGIGLPGIRRSSWRRSRSSARIGEQWRR
jgi:hypothetical protein